MAAAAGAAAAAARRRAIGEADVAWAAYAKARGLQFRPSHLSWAHERLPRIDAVVEGVSIAIELVRDLQTAVLAVPALPVHGNLDVTRETAFSGITKFFGAQDIVLGDKAFDDTFLVKASASPVAEALLSPPIRAELLALWAESFAYDDGSEYGHPPIVALYMPRVVAEGTVLDRALRVVIETARVREGMGPYR